MSRPVIMTQAELNSKCRITPTAFAEEAFEAKRARLQFPIGPAGIPIPFARATYRPTVDELLLKRIATRAYDDWRDSQVSAEAKARAGEVLVADLRARYPADEMTVLKKHGFAKPISSVVINFTGAGYRKSIFQDLAQTLDLPEQAARYRIGDAGESAPVPTELVEHYDRVATVRDAERDSFTYITYWPGQIKARQKRWPTWSEIEEAWPKIGEWLANQRGRR